MRILAAFAPILTATILACRPYLAAPVSSPAPTATTPVVTRAVNDSGSCAMMSRDSIWFIAALHAWEYTRERLLLLPTAPFPPMILFDTRCAFHVDVSDGWRASGHYHGGLVPLPDGRTMRPRSVGVTSPAAGDSAVFLALALPEVWRGDPRYAAIDNSREEWETYLISAFIHEMTHSRMMLGLLPRLRALEVAVYPDTVEDNAIQNRFEHDLVFSRLVRRETELLYRAATTSSRRSRVQLARDAATRMLERRERVYVGNLSPWAELEQRLLDLEGVAQWAAFMHARNTTHRALSFGRALTRFRAEREFWSEDQGLALILLLDALVPGWQTRMISERNPESSLDLLLPVVSEPR